MNRSNFEESANNINDLLEEIESLEGDLYGGESEDLKRGTTAIKRLKDTEVNFGNPNGQLIPLTEEGLAEKGIELNYEIRTQMERYNFYSMMVNIDIKPQTSVLISKLECELNFGPKGEYEPITHHIFPESQWQTMLGAEMGLNVGLDGNLNFSVGVEKEKLNQVKKILGKNFNLDGNLNSKNSLKFSLFAGDFSYKQGRFKILATGKNGSNCFWRFEQPEIKDQSTIEFYIIFKALKVKRQIDLEGEVWVEPDINWLCGNIEHLKENLSDYFKDLFANRTTASQKFRLGKKETWDNFTLPKVREKKLLGLF